MVLVIVSGLIVRRSLRLRVAATFAAVCLAFVGVLGITLYNASENMDTALIDQLITEEMGFLIERYRSGWRDPPAPGPHVEYYIARTASERRALPQAVRAL